MTKDPYKIWVSEIILQQTQVTQGLPYYTRFISLFPSVESLAAAPLDKVLKSWEGLGYYSRARNLHKGAQYVVDHLHGKIPNSREGLLPIPGIGPYTSAAIASFAFDRQEAVVDGNVLRVISRVFGRHDDISKTATRKAFEHLALQALGQRSSADFNRAMMNLGAQICKPQSPLCDRCPVNSICTAYSDETIDRLPYSSKKLKKRKRYLHYILIFDENQALVTHQREGKDIWKGLYELPLIETEKASITTHKVSTHKTVLDPFLLKLYKKTKQVKHQLTHQELHISFYMQKAGMTQAQCDSISKVLKSKAFPRPIHQFLTELQSQESV